MDEVLLPTKVYAPDGREAEFSMITKDQREEFARRYAERQAFMARYVPPDPKSIVPIWTI